MFGFGRKLACLLVVGLSAVIHTPTTTCLAEVVGLRPVADTFVVDPGDDPPHAKMLGIEDNDFGGSGAREVAAATACNSTYASPNDQPHGLFRTLLEFDSSELAGATIGSVSLSLYVSREVGTKGKDIFNPTSMSGYFNISLLSLPAGYDWTQGYGKPEDLTQHVYDSSLGLSHNLLEALLAESDVELLDIGTLYFDASLLDPVEAQTWLTFDLDSEVLNEALTSGEVFTLLLSPADDSVSLRFSCRNQNWAEGEDPVIWDAGPILNVLTAVPEPCSAMLLIVALCVAVTARRSVAGRNRMAGA